MRLSAKAHDRPDGWRSCRAHGHRVARRRCGTTDKSIVGVVAARPPHGGSGIAEPGQCRCARYHRCTALNRRFGFAALAEGTIELPSAGSCLILISQDPPVSEARQQSRTEEATDKRLTDARDDGNVPMSREVPNFAYLLAALLVIAVLGQAFASHLGGSACRASFECRIDPSRKRWRRDAAVRCRRQCAPQASPRRSSWRSRRGRLSPLSLQNPSGSRLQACHARYVAALADARA